jgi:hypothetical protein
MRTLEATQKNADGHENLPSELSATPLNTLEYNAV